MMDLTIAVPVILALVEVAKRTGLPNKYAPVLSVVLGVVFVGIWGDSVLTDALFEGLVTGLTASGLYSGVKAQMK
jgi:hypothetical protein